MLHLFPMLLACPACDSRFRISPQLLGDGRDVRCSKCGNQWFAPPADLIEESGEMPNALPRSVGREAPPPAPAAAPDILPSMTASDDSFEHHLKEEAAAERAPETPIPFEPDLDDAPLSEETSGYIEKEIDFEALEAALASQSATARSPVLARRAGAFNATPWLMLASLLIVLNLAGALLIMRDKVIAALPASAKIYEMIGFGSTKGLALGDLLIHGTGKGAERGYDISGVVYNGTKAAQPFPPIEIDMVDKDGEIIRAWPFQTAQTIPPGGTSPFRNLPDNKLTSSRVEEAAGFRVRIGTPLELSLKD